jgi:hypothetical protein
MRATAAPAITDFTHGLDFAPCRWHSFEPIPFHKVARHGNVDATIDVIVRFHDPTRIKRLSRCLFGLNGQSHQPIQVLLMLHGLDAAGVAAVEKCVDAFDWSEPRRRPVITNVDIPPTGDHRARLWNAGLETGSGRYLGFCDFDDVSYTAGYGYLLHRLQLTGSAVAFASALHVDCTPMSGFDFVFAKRTIPGRDRYDFFVSGFCPPNSLLIDRLAVAKEDLRADEGLSKYEDYRVLVKLVSKYRTDWASIGTPVGDYIHHTDGSNTIMSHRSDSAGAREWEEARANTHQYLATLATWVPLPDIVAMRLKEGDLLRELKVSQEISKRERSEVAMMKRSLSWRLTRPFREVERVARRLRVKWRGAET